MKEELYLMYQWDKYDPLISPTAIALLTSIANGSLGNGFSG